jgi:hypothetical protein
LLQPTQAAAHTQPALDTRTSTFVQTGCRWQLRQSRLAENLPGGRSPLCCGRMVARRRLQWKEGRGGGTLGGIVGIGIIFLSGVCKYI